MLNRKIKLTPKAVKQLLRRRKKQLAAAETVSSLSTPGPTGCFADCCGCCDDGTPCVCDCEEFPICVQIFGLTLGGPLGNGDCGMDDCCEGITILDPNPRWTLISEIDVAYSDTYVVQYDNGFDPPEPCRLLLSYGCVQEDLEPPYDPDQCLICLSFQGCCDCFGAERLCQDSCCQYQADFTAFECDPLHVEAPGCDMGLTLGGCCRWTFDEMIIDGDAGTT